MSSNIIYTKPICACIICKKDFSIYGKADVQHTVTRSLRNSKILNLEHHKAFFVTNIIVHSVVTIVIF